MQIRTYLSASSVCALLLLGAACSKPTTEPTASKGAGSSATTPSGAEAKRTSQALVRFVNATPEPKDLYFGDTKPFASVPPETATAYMELPSERHQFKLYSAGNNIGDPLATNSESPNAGMHYTILAVAKEDGKPALNAISDELARPAPGKARIRVVHAAAGVNKVDLYPVAGKDPLISGVSFNNATNYKEVDPMTTELDVRVNGSKKNLVDIKNVRIDPDKMYTIVLFGGNGRPVAAKVIEDQLMSMVSSR